jgi:hypothetical protein
MAAAAAVPGAMTSVAARREDVQPLLDEWKLDVVVANHNSPKQLVLSGATEAIAEAERRLSEKGMAATRLEVATAFHSSLVSPAAQPLREFLASVPMATPKIPVFANTTAAPYPSDPEAMRDLLAHQLAKPVRFVEQIEAMYESGVRTFVEVGPGRVLTGLVGHILKARPHRAIALDRKGRPGWASLQQGLALLSVAGVAVDYAPLWAAFAPVADPRTRRKPAMALKMNGSSYGKIYPPVQGAVALPKPNPPSPPAEPATSNAAPAPSRLQRKVAIRLCSSPGCMLFKRASARRPRPTRFSSAPWPSRTRRSCARRKLPWPIWPACWGEPRRCRASPRCRLGFPPSPHPSRR